MLPLPSLRSVASDHFYVVFFSNGTMGSVKLSSSVVSEQIDKFPSNCIISGSVEGKQVEFTGMLTANRFSFRSSTVKSCPSESGQSSELSSLKNVETCFAQGHYTDPEGRFLV